MGRGDGVEEASGPRLAREGRSFSWEPYLAASKARERRPGRHRGKRGRRYQRQQSSISPGCSDEQLRQSDAKADNIRTATATLYIAQSVRSTYLRSPRSAAPMQDGAAAAAQIKDNLGVKQDAAVDVGRTENDIRASRRCELPLSRNSSTDEAQLESGTFFSVRQDLAVSTPSIRSRRRVTNALPAGADTHADGFARPCATAGALQAPDTHTDSRARAETSPKTATQAAGPRKSTRASSTASRSTAAASGSASRSTSARARSSRLDRMPRSTSRSCGGPPNRRRARCRPTTT